MSFIKLKLIFYLLITFLFYSCNDEKQYEKNIKVVPFEVNGGWGFDINKNGKLYIHQEHIPAISGKWHFKTKEEAIKVGELMKIKISNNILPPSITIIELDSLKISK